MSYVFPKRVVQLAILMFALAGVNVLILATQWARQDKLLEDIVQSNAALDRVVAQIEMSKQNQKDASIPDLFLWKAEDLSSAETLLQDRVLEIAKGLRIRPESFGASYLQRNSSTPIAAFEIEVSISLESLLMFVEAIENNSPRIAVGYLRIRSSSSGSSGPTDTIVQIRAVVWAYWEAAS